MGVHVVDARSGRTSGVGERALDRPRRAAALGLGRGQVVRVGGGGVAEQLAEDRGAARLARPSSASSTSTPAPSPITKPSRRASNGREIRLVEVASIAAKAALGERRERGLGATDDRGVGVAAWIMRMPAPIAWAPAAHAETTP